jgi:hypothetical protein
MKGRKKHKGIVALIVLAGITLLLVRIANDFHISPSITIPVITIVVIVLGAILWWVRITNTADGDNWWQDDNASGWRGY